MEYYEDEKESFATCGQCNEKVKPTELLDHIRKKHPKRWKELGFDKIDDKLKKNKAR